MNLEQAQRVSGLFVELVNSGRLNPTDEYFKTGDGDGYDRFSPLGYLLWGSRPPTYSSLQSERTHPIGVLRSYRYSLFNRYVMTADEAEIIQTEWLKGHDVGNLIRMPLMVREED